MTAQRSGKSNEDGGISEEMILKVTKEITVKFIEVGRITPSSFSSAFKDIYKSIDETVRKG